jgi:hypothetical protein
MNTATNIITQAGAVAAGAVLLHITTTFTRQSETLEKRAENLNKEFDEIESQHKFLLETILPLIPLGDDENPHRQAAERESFSLNM